MENKIYIYSKAELGELSKAVLEAERKAKADTKTNPYILTSVDVKKNWNKLVAEVEPKATTQLKMVSYRLYDFLFLYRQNTSNYTDEQLAKTELEEEYDGSCYFKIEDIASEFGVKAEQIRKAVKLLTEMHLLIVQLSAERSKHFKYYFFPLYVQNKALCQKYKSNIVRKTSEQKAKSRPKTAKQTVEEAPKGEVIAISDYLNKKAPMVMTQQLETTEAELIKVTQWQQHFEKINKPYNPFDVIDALGW